MCLFDYDKMNMIKHSMLWRDSKWNKHIGIFIDHLLLHTLIDTSHLQLRVNGTSLPRDRPCLINYYSWRSNLCLHHDCTRCEFIDAFMPYEITIVQLPSCLIQVKCNLYYLLVGIFLADWFWKSGSYCNRQPSPLWRSSGSFMLWYKRVQGKKLVQDTDSPRWGTASCIIIVNSQMVAKYYSLEWLFWWHISEKFITS